MPRQTASNSFEQEARIAKALAALYSREFTPIRAAAEHFKVTKSTLQRGQTEDISRRAAQEKHQMLSKAEENTLVR
jgi:hypothetical protein